MLQTDKKKEEREFSGAHIEKLYHTSRITMELIDEQEITVPESSAGVDTGIELERQDRLVISASGQIWAGVPFTGANGPRGWNNVELDPKFPLIGSHPYSLIGKLDGRYFYVGDGVDRFYFGSGSRLMLRTNDDTPGGGSGAFTVLVQQWRRRSRR